MPNLLRLNVACSSYDQVVEKCVTWARQKESHCLTFSAVHMVMEAHDKPEYRAKLNSLDMVNPDGMPVVWALRMLGYKSATRVYGPDATVWLLKAAAKRRHPGGVLRGQREHAAATRGAGGEELSRNPDRLCVFAAVPQAHAGRGCGYSGGNQCVRRAVYLCGPGCPKQEEWMIDHRDRIPAVLLAVGAAFDFLAATKPQAPRWMMRSGLEWVFRLACEPRRLAGRYFKHNPRFVALVLRQWMSTRRLAERAD